MRQSRQGCDPAGKLVTQSTLRLTAAHDFLMAAATVLNTWSEVGLQIKDGYANDPLSLKKFGAIASKSMQAVEGLAYHQIYVEFAPNNQGLARYVISGLQQSGDQLVVELAPD